MSQMDTIEERTLSKVKWRLVPYVCLLFFIAYIDRTNLGYAALEMNKDLGISMIAYGALTSVFYLPYFLFEVPSNMLLNRYGARRWLARIMITWGIVTCLAMFVQQLPADSRCAFLPRNDGSRVSSRGYVLFHIVASTKGKGQGCLLCSV